MGWSKLTTKKGQGNGGGGQGGGGALDVFGYSTLLEDDNKGGGGAGGGGHDTAAIKHHKKLKPKKVLRNAIRCGDRDIGGEGEGEGEGEERQEFRHEAEYTSPSRGPPQRRCSANGGGATTPTTTREGQRTTTRHQKRDGDNHQGIRSSTTGKAGGNKEQHKPSSQGSGERERQSRASQQGGGERRQQAQAVDGGDRQQRRRRPNATAEAVRPSSGQPSCQERKTNRAKRHDPVSKSLPPTTTRHRGEEVAPPPRRRRHDAPERCPPTQRSMTPSVPGMLERSRTTRTLVTIPDDCGGDNHDYDGGNDNKTQDISDRTDSTTRSSESEDVRRRPAPRRHKDKSHGSSSTGASDGGGGGGTRTTTTTRRRSDGTKRASGITIRSRQTATSSDDRSIASRSTVCMPSKPDTWCYSSNHILINEERSYVRLGRLRRSRILDEQARVAADRMAGECAIVHTDMNALADELESSTSADGAAAVVDVLGENAGSGDSIREVHCKFMNNIVERENILDERFTDMGIGTARGLDGNLYVCQLFKG